jgi:hypothetical protein
METGEVLLSKVIDQNIDDQVYYAGYDGNKESLIPARNGVVDTNDGNRRQLQGLLNANRQLKPMSTLSSELIRTSCSSMAGALQQHLASILP